MAKKNYIEKPIWDYFDLPQDNTKIVNQPKSFSIPRKDGIKLPDGTFVSYNDLNSSKGTLTDKKGKPSKDNRTHYERNRARLQPKTLGEYLESIEYQQKNLWDNEHHPVQGLNKTVVPAALAYLSAVSAPISLLANTKKLNTAKIAHKLLFNKNIDPKIILKGLLSGSLGGAAEGMLKKGDLRTEEQMYDILTDTGIGAGAGVITSGIPIVNQTVRKFIPKIKPNSLLNKNFSTPNTSFTLTHQGKTLLGNDGYSVGIYASSNKGKGSRNLLKAIKELPENTRLYEENLSLDSYETLLKAKKLGNKASYIEHSDWFNNMGRDTKYAQRFANEKDLKGEISEELAEKIVEDLNKTLKSLGYKERAETVINPLTGKAKINSPRYEIKKIIKTKTNSTPQTKKVITQNNTPIQNSNQRDLIDYFQDINIDQNSNIEEILQNMINNRSNIIP